METVEVVKTNVGELKDYDWLSYHDGDGNVVLIETDEDIKAASKALGLTPEAVSTIKDALQFMVQSMIEELEKDLADIWLAATKDNDPN